MINTPYFVLELSELLNRKEYKIVKYIYQNKVDGPLTQAKVLYLISEKFGLSLKGMLTP